MDDRAVVSIFPHDLPLLTQEEMAREVVNWLDEHPGIGVHPTSRIPMICKTVLKCAGRQSTPDNPEYTELVQSFKDVEEWWFVTRVLGSALADPPFLEPFVRAAANDSVLPERSGSQTKGRDAQFELFVGAVGFRAGLRVENLGEAQPDWLMRSATRTWSVEAKRAKSAEAVNRLAHKAVEQIDRSKIGGVIVIDVSAIEGADGRRLLDHIPDQELNHLRKMKGERIRQVGLPQICKLIGNTPVGLFVAHDYVVRPAGIGPDGAQTPWGLIGMWWAYLLEPDSSPHYSRYLEFWELFEAGLPAL